jgi:hypothetical protein
LTNSVKTQLDRFSDRDGVDWDTMQLVRVVKDLYSELLAIGKELKDLKHEINQD